MERLSLRIIPCIQGIYRLHPNWTEKHQKISTFHLLSLETLQSPLIMPKNLSGHSVASMKNTAVHGASIGLQRWHFLVLLWTLVMQSSTWKAQMGLALIIVVVPMTNRTVHELSGWQTTTMRVKFLGNLNVKLSVWLMTWFTHIYQIWTKAAPPALSMSKVNGRACNSWRTCEAWTLTFCRSSST